MKHDEQDLKFLLERGRYIQSIVNRLRQWFSKNPYPIELSKFSIPMASASKKYGGINQIWNELEAEGIIEIDQVEGKQCIFRTVIMCEFKKEKRA